ncbi:dihydropyrimidinase [Youngiibacter multivorans]|uniref:Dihydropyrimidinase n=1 Tax=Youngiibacter multivorans TaxID=937251 RepID=A0ABS4G3W0_9CLOT|nr:dihydropyrimidinase [Youngiibacter multivorans]MBP1919219.1 dihydropyrimidinase [Youngiibacter multivorans]
MDTIIRNGLVANSEGTVKCDILISEGRIKALGPDLTSDGAEVIDAGGRLVLPGGVDVHTHFDLQAGSHRAADDFHTGTIAAACGGTTTIVDHMAFGPKGCSLRHQEEVYHGLADRKAVIDYGFHGVLQHVDDKVLQELEEMTRDGIPSFKAYMTYDFRLSDSEILRAMEAVKKTGGVLTVHAENHEKIEHLRKTFIEENRSEAIYHAMSRPNLTESEAVGRLIGLSEMAGWPNLYLVHISAKESLEEVRRARKNGARNIFVETCTQYLTLTEDKYDLPDGEALKYIMSPPLRKQSDVDALWKGIADGDVQVVGTDHCPFFFEEKLMFGLSDFTKCPNGGPGVEERMRILFSEGVMKKRISMKRFIEVTSLNPAKVMGLYPEKGNLMPGADADIFIIDPEKSGTFTSESIHGAAGYTLYEGMEYMGEVELVMQRGRVIVKDGIFLGSEGDGRYLKRRTTG